MRLFRSGYFEEKFKQESIDLFRKIARDYETGNLDFAICGDSQDVYAVLRKLLRQNDKAKMSGSIEMKVGALSALSLEMPHGMQCVVYTCEERMRDKKLADLFRIMEERYVPLRKKPAA